MRDFLFAGTILILLGVSAALYAETAIKVSGQVRTRFEFDGRSFGLTRSAAYTDMRTRLGVTATLDSNVAAFVQFQDSRRFGAASSDRPATGTTASTANVDLHQTYITVDNLLAKSLKLQAGRFEIALGNERVIGAVGWSNVARSFEGADLSWQSDIVAARFFVLQPIERTGGKSSEEFRIYGLNVALSKTGLQFLGLYEDDTDPTYVGQDRMDRISIGGYYYLTSGRTDFTVNGVYQFGDMRWIPSQVESQDIAAYMLTAECGVSFTTRSKPRVAVGFDYTSGDKDTTNSKMTAYDNLYYTGHKFRGFMDYFVSSNVDNYRGLFDLIFRAKLEPTSGWTLRGDIHRFATAVESDDALGWEIDLTATTSKVKGLKFDLGASLFLASESYARTSDPDPGFWMFTSATVDF